MTNRTETTAPARRRSARDYHAALTASVDAYFDDDDSAAFHARQRAIWDEIVARGPRMHAAVNALLRAGLTPSVAVRASYRAAGGIA